MRPTYIKTRKSTLGRLLMARLLVACLLASFGLITAGAAFAGQRIVVEKNHTLRVALSAPAGTVIVGNPDIADVSVVDSRTVYIVGKGFGNSAVVITDHMGRPLFDGQVVVTAVSTGSITVYKGLKPSSVVCSNICVEEDPTTSTTPAPGSVAMTTSPSITGVAPGTAMQVTQ